MLPLHWVERVFERLTVLYGHEFLRRWEGMDLDAVKASWAHELGAFGSLPDAITFALENLPGGRAPDVREFRALCYRYTPPGTQRIGGPLANPEIVRQCMERLKAPQLIEDAKPLGGGPDLRWAHRIMQRVSSGERVRQAALAMAQRALEKRSETA